MLQTFLEDGSTSPEEVHPIIREQLGEKVAMALSEYNGHMSNLLVKVVSCFPIFWRLLKLIVFPFSEGYLHWSATFVISADSIFDSVEQRNTSPNEGAALQPCFFRYCSLRNDATCKFELNQGIIWFLNLCCSYEKLMRENLGSQRIIFIDTSGSETEGNMLGTESFPALCINEDGYFPM